MKKKRNSEEQWWWHGSVSDNCVIWLEMSFIWIIIITSAIILYGAEENLSGTNFIFTQIKWHRKLICNICNFSIHKLVLECVTYKQVCRIIWFKVIIMQLSWLDVTHFRVKIMQYWLRDFSSGGRGNIAHRFMVGHT